MEEQQGGGGSRVAVVGKRGGRTRCWLLGMCVCFLLGGMALEALWIVLYLKCVTLLLSLSLSLSLCVCVSSCPWMLLSLVPSVTL